MARARTRPPAPETVEDRCVTCGETTLQEVLKGRVVKGGLGVEGTFRCTECETVVSGLVSFPAPLVVPLIVSYEDESVPAQVEVPEDEMLEIGDEFLVDDERVELTGIELKDEGRRVEKARADEIRTLWGKNRDRIKVKFGINEGDVTHSFETWFGPEEEVHVGEAFDLGDDEVVVDRIVTTEGSKIRGGWNVRSIKRVWLRRPSKRRERREEREDRKDGDASGRARPTTDARTGDKGTGRASSRASGRPSQGRPPSKGRGRPGAGRPRGRGPTGGARGRGRRTGQGPTGRR